MASIYDALADHLAKQPGQRYSMILSEIERLIGRHLPTSARPPHPTWYQRWENSGSTKSRHSQSKSGWLAVGWEPERESFDWERSTVVFRKEKVRWYWNRT
jgi:hypothetical protein